MDGEKKISISFIVVLGLLLEWAKSIMCIFIQDFVNYVLLFQDKGRSRQDMLNTRLNVFFDLRS